MLFLCKRPRQQQNDKQINHTKIFWKNEELWEDPNKLNYDKEKGWASTSNLYKLHEGNPNLTPEQGESLRYIIFRRIKY